MTDPRMIEMFQYAIDEAEDYAPESGDTFARGYLMGLCVGASLANLPEGVWASPQRHERRAKAPPRLPA